MRADNAPLVLPRRGVSLRKKLYIIGDYFWHKFKPRHPKEAKLVLFTVLFLVVGMPLLGYLLIELPHSLYCDWGMKFLPKAKISSSRFFFLQKKKQFGSSAACRSYDRRVRQMILVGLSGGWTMP